MTPGTVTLGEALHLQNDWVTVDPSADYNLASVRLWGGGVVPRGTVPGTTLEGARRRRVRAGQFLVARIDARHGAMGLVPQSLDGALVSNDFLPFEVDREVLEPRFLEWISRADWFVAACAQASEGTTNRVRLAADRFLRIKVRRPLADQQIAVVSVLDAARKDADAIRNLSTEGGATVAALLESSISTALRPSASDGGSSEAAHLLLRQRDVLGEQPHSRHNNAHPHNPTVDSGGLYQIPASWCWTDLGSALTHIVDCVNDTPDFADQETGYLGLKSTNVRPFELDLSTVWWVTEEDAARWNRRLEPQPRDILLTREAPMGFACLLPDGISACLTQRIVLLRANPRFVLPDYVLYYLNSRLFKEQIAGAERGLTSRHIRVGDLPKFKIPLAPLQEQHRIVASLDRLRSLLAQLDAGLAERGAAASMLIPSTLRGLAPGNGDDPAESPP
jgi:type I restriction enzyme S subunit